jgi:hypothetical protein
MSSGPEAGMPTGEDWARVLDELDRLYPGQYWKLTERRLPPVTPTTERPVRDDD